MTEIRKRATKTTAENADDSVPAAPVEPSPKPTTAKAAPKGRPPLIPGFVFAKLILFSVLLFALPLITYFATLNRLFSGNHNYSAIAAVIVANCVVIAYVIAAFIENDDDLKQEDKDSKGKST
ncbi:vacuolar ATPase assembly integral membrane protein vma21 [Rhizophlyctis rosea]|nr:vacuolar ATPase assembly integral membrane protein vma21 [Rhizophlyctis rosea]